MDFSDVAKSRRSVRSYDSSREITDKNLRDLFDAVKYSPSSYNLQPWEFVVVRNSDNKERLKACAYGQKHVAEASATVIVLGNTRPAVRAQEVMEDRIRKGLMDSEKEKDFRGSVRKFSENPEMGKIWAVKSTSLAAMSLMLAAADMGLASCPMEGFDADCVRKEFGIPEEYEVVMLIALGYGKEEKERPFRFGYEDMVHLEKHGKK